jgi:hypothetical protein
MTGRFRSKGDKPMAFDPWPSVPPSKARTDKKTARLVGKEAGKVYVLVKLHNWAGRAIYLYHLLKKDMIHIARPSQQQWDKYASEGVEIPHPGGIQATDVEEWVRYGKEQAALLNLTVAE